MDSTGDYIDAVEAGWASIHPDVDTTAVGLMQRIIRAGRLAERQLKAVAARHGVRVRGDYETLAALRRGEPLTAVELAADLDISTSGMSGRLDRLDELGLIARNAHPQDRRALLITLTDAGRDLIDDAFRSSAAAQAAMARFLQPADLARLDELLRRLLRELGDQVSGWAAARRARRGRHRERVTGSPRHPPWPRDRAPPAAAAPDGRA